jgi:large-conductance mechanosensitive channel
MNDSNRTSKTDSNGINTKGVLVTLIAFVLLVLGFYFFNFNDRLSDQNGVWGTFGDYVGGILNPVIAAFAFYLIAKTYELQKRELEATRSY